MQQSDNPARRLHGLLADALTKNQGEQTLKVWASVFAIPEKEAAGRVFYYLGLLHHLTYAIEDRIRRIPEINTELYLRAIPDVRLALSPIQMNASFHDTAGKYLNAGTMTVLEFSANELAKHHHEDPIPVGDLKAIRDQASTLLEDIRVADIDADLRALLMDLLVTMIRCVDEYRIRGAAGLKDVVAFSIGQFILNHDLYEKTKKETVVQRFSKLVGRVSTVVSAAIKVMALYGKVAPILGLPEISEEPKE